MKYINSTTNRILLDLDSTIKIYTKALFIKEKKRLRYILVIVLSDIYIIYDIQSLLNYLELLVVISYFISEKNVLYLITLALIKL